MLESPFHNGIISWSEDGESVIIHNNTLFETNVLPQYFIISRMDSFTRQMNLYEFKRTSDARKQRQKGGADKFTTFVHPNFKRDHPELIATITRKKRPTVGQSRSPKPTHHTQALYSDELTEVVEDIYNNFYPCPIAPTLHPLSVDYSLCDPFSWNSHLMQFSEPPYFINFPPFKDQNM
ncbi:Heat shock factor protein 3, variant 2 [Entomophthora muscae]|nr:Heat shock factor protein 3, variant 2 [Entomophthora muscae]